MYATAKGNFDSKGGPKKERPLCTHCNMLGHTVDKCYKIHGYPLGYKHKGKSTANAYQVSYPQGANVEVSSFASAQCPITKAQCERLLALFNSGADQGQNHHVASISTSGGVSGLTTGAYGVLATTGVTSTSLTPSVNANSNFIDTVSGPCSLEHTWFGDVFYEHSFPFAYVTTNAADPFTPSEVVVAPSSSAVLVRFFLLMLTLLHQLYQHLQCLSRSQLGTLDLLLTCRTMHVLHLLLVLLMTLHRASPTLIWSLVTNLTC
ncbi:hypothetical protein CMV_003616 [Castanea mollissima]|uniref:Uncharacterized protein n=1 Tax=Castanea mollissima TaxID=60419 RepID=A0A8J4RT21_9ROSI|nr:hypothetical protein CMV_003616 [Castanea mollissima]